MRCGCFPITLSPGTVPQPADNGCLGVYTGGQPTLQYQAHAEPDPSRPTGGAQPQAVSGRPAHKLVLGSGHRLSLMLALVLSRFI